MAEFLIKASDSPVPDSSGKWHLSRIVVIQEDGHEWGGKEAPPKFYIIKVPGVSKESATQYLEEWRHNVTLNIVSSNPSTDEYRIKVITDRVSVSGKNSFKPETVEEFITRWNGAIVSIINHEVVFDISVYGAICSSQFWDTDAVSEVVFVETSYNQSTGDHVIQVQSSPFTNAQMKHAVERRGGLVIPPDSFSMNRSIARQLLENDIEEAINNVSYDRRRWYVTASGMSALQAAGGIVTVTPAQFINNIADGLDD